MSSAVSNRQARPDPSTRMENSTEETTWSSDSGWEPGHTAGGRAGENENNYVSRVGTQTRKDFGMLLFPLQNCLQGPCSLGDLIFLSLHIQWLAYLLSAPPPPFGSNARPHGLSSGQLHQPTDAIHGSYRGFKLCPLCFGLLSRAHDSFLHLEKNRTYSHISYRKPQTPLQVY